MPWDLLALGGGTARLDDPVPTTGADRRRPFCKCGEGRGLVDGLLGVGGETWQALVESWHAVGESWDGKHCLAIGDNCRDGGEEGDGDGVADDAADEAEAPDLSNTCRIFAICDDRPRCTILLLGKSIAPSCKFCTGVGRVEARL